jgi:hypothetical protein
VIQQNRENDNRNACGEVNGKRGGGAGVATQFLKSSGVETPSSSNLGRPNEAEWNESSEVG